MREEIFIFMDRRNFLGLPFLGILPLKEKKKVRIFYVNFSKYVDKFVFVDEESERMRIMSFLYGELEDDFNGPLCENVSECVLRDGKWEYTVIPFFEYLKDIGYEEFV